MTAVHLVPQTTDRGLRHLPPIAGTYPQHAVRVYESPAAMRPCLWLNARDGDGKATIQLTLEAASQLAEQIQHLVREHCQVRDETTEDGAA